MRERLLRSLESEQDFEAISENILEDAGERKFASDTFAASSETLVMCSCGVVFEDLRRVRQARKKTPGLEALLVGTSEREGDFLQYCARGNQRFPACRSLRKRIGRRCAVGVQWKAACGSAQCEILFRYFEKEGEAFPSAAMHRDLGFTWREQQMVPLLTRGRLDIVDVCRQSGFLA